MYKENFHSHTYYCDGKNSPADMASAAYNLKFDALGFSGHAFIKDFECDWCMTPENTLKYISEFDSYDEYFDFCNLITNYEYPETLRDLIQLASKV